MNKQESYSVLTETPVDGASPTGTSHTLTMWVDKVNKKAKISCGSLPIENGDQVIWDLKDEKGNPLKLNTGETLEIIFGKKLSSGPKGPTAAKMTLDISEDNSAPLKPYPVTYSVKLKGDLLTVTDDEISPQLVIDKVGKPPGPGDGGCDDDDDESAGPRHRRRHHTG